jgi:hypothetical protein
LAAAVTVTSPALLPTFPPTSSTTLANIRRKHNKERLLYKVPYDAPVAFFESAATYRCTKTRVHRGRSHLRRHRHQPFRPPSPSAVHLFCRWVSLVFLPLTCFSFLSSQFVLCGSQEDSLQSSRPLE